jgi:hypothetical protein
MSKERGENGLTLCLVVDRRDVLPVLWIDEGGEVGARAHGPIVEIG